MSYLACACLQLLAVALLACAPPVCWAEEPVSTAAAPVTEIAAVDWPQREDNEHCWSQKLETVAGRPPCGHAEGAAAAVSPKHSAKVAFLFMAQEAIHTEPLWTAFFAAAAEVSLAHTVLPTRPLHRPIQSTKYLDMHCEPLPLPWDDISEWQHKTALPESTDSAHWLRQVCGSELTGREIYDQQQLFSIYVHRWPGAPAFHEGSLFYDRDIEDRTFDTWGQPSRVIVMRKLLEAALGDRRNTRFILVTPYDVPIRNPMLLWAQSVAESHVSRVQLQTSQLHPDDVMEMAAADMAAHKVIGRGAWPEVYRGSEFAALTRMHAEVVAKEDHLWPFFHKWCRSQGKCQHYDFDASDEQICASHELYIPSVLAHYGQNGTVDNVGRSTFYDAHTRPGTTARHPRVFEKGQLQEALSVMLDSFAGCYELTFLSGPTAASLFERHAEHVCSRPESHVEKFIPRADYVSRVDHIELLDLPRVDRSKARADRILSSMQRNLAASGWLGTFEPMPLHCPLIGQKVAPDFVPELLEVSWSCDGLGYAWECVAGMREDV